MASQVVLRWRLDNVREDLLVALEPHLMGGSPETLMSNTPRFCTAPDRAPGLAGLLALHDGDALLPVSRTPRGLLLGRA